VSKSAYKCGTCAYTKISDYSGKAHLDHMGQCTGSDERYYFKSRCFDGIKECPNGEDEVWSNNYCNDGTVTTTTVDPVTGKCGHVRTSGVHAEINGNAHIFRYNKGMTMIFKGLGILYQIWVFQTMRFLSF